MTRRTYINESHRLYSEACQQEVEKMSLSPLTAEEMAAQMERNHRESLTAAKLIFLDFDGVLNTETWQHRCQKKGVLASDDFGPLFAPEAVRSLTCILKAVPEAKIIITSSWALEGFGRMKGLWLQRRLPGHIIGIAEPTDVVPPYRGADIRAWFQKNALEEKDYVILDDTDDFFPEQKPHLVKTSPACGLTAEAILTTVLATLP